MPQRALPDSMLPEGHTPGDKTLYLLARLSKEVDSQRAGELLTGEIQRRNKHLPEGAKIMTVTNTDIKRVLDKIGSSENVPNDRHSVDQTPSEASSIPWPSTIRGSSGPATSGQPRSSNLQDDQDIRCTIGTLPPPSRVKLPLKLTYFTLNFLREDIGSDEVAFVKLGPKMPGSIRIADLWN